MRNKKVLVFGNGIEAHFNEKLKNFNNEIKQWIKELNQSNWKRDDLFNKLKNGSDLYTEYDFLPTVLINEPTSLLSQKNKKNDQSIFWNTIKKNNYFEKTLKLVEKELNKNENITIEDALKNVGDKFIQLLSKETCSLNEVSAVFKLLKIILGYYIEIICNHKVKVDNAINALKSNDFNWEILEPLQDYGYDKIYTTNYSNFVNEFIKLWKTKNSFGTYKVKNIHGEYFSKSKSYFERYDTLQINLEEKNSSKAIKSDFRSFEIPFDYSLELYGLDIRNDEITLTEIIQLMINERLNYHLKSNTLTKKDNILNVEIIYNYFEKNKITSEDIQKSILKSLCQKFELPNYSNDFEILFFEKEKDNWIYSLTLNKQNMLLIKFTVILNDVKKHDIFQAMQSLIKSNSQPYFYNNESWFPN